MSESEDESSSSTSKVPGFNRISNDADALSGHNWKRTKLSSFKGTQQTHVPCGLGKTSNAKTPKPSSLQHAKLWAETVAFGILLISDDQNYPNGAVTFGQLSEELPKKSLERHTKYGVDHWTFRAKETRLTIDRLAAVETYMDKIDDDVLHSPWVRHDHPRFLSINGSCIKEQSVGESQLDHEVCSLIVRTIVLSDKICLYPGKDLWRMFFEPDLSTCILSGENPWEVKSIQDQFLSQLRPHNLSNCKMFIMPATLQTGWCAYAWDMERKLTHILNPCADSAQYSTLKNTHDAIADKLHIGLFSCIFKFYDTWHVDCLNWKKMYDIVSSEVFTKHESGMAMIQMARYFNGFGVAEILNKVNVRIRKINLLAEIANLPGNAVEPPAALKAIVE